MPILAFLEIGDNFSMVAQLEGHLKVVVFKGLCDFDCFLGFFFWGFDFWILMNRL